MSGLGWAAVGVFTASIVLGLIAVVAARGLRSDMYQAPDKTVWGLLFQLIMLGRPTWHHEGSEAKAEGRLAWHHYGSGGQSERDGGR
jgi:hypothetical protein